MRPFCADPRGNLFQVRDVTVLNELPDFLWGRIVVIAPVAGGMPSSIPLASRDTRARIWRVILGVIH